jgi:glutathione S-transferase
MTLAETNTPYELQVIDFATGEHKKPAHVARQPFGQVPALQDGDFELYESRAICRYINDKAGGALLPRDLRERARVEQWISVETSDFSGPAMKFVFEHIFKHPQSAETLATAAEQLGKALPVLDAQLARAPFVAGSSFTLADISFMPYFEYAMVTPAREQIARYPNVTAWWSKVSEKPTWRAVTGRA